MQGCRRQQTSTGKVLRVGGYGASARRGGKRIRPVCDQTAAERTLYSLWGCLATGVRASKRCQTSGRILPPGKRVLQEVSMASTRRKGRKEEDRIGGFGHPPYSGYQLGLPFFCWPGGLVNSRNPGEPRNCALEYKPMTQGRAPGYDHSLRGQPHFR